MTLVELLYDEWRKVIQTTIQAISFEDCLHHWECLTDFRGLPMLHMAKVAHLASEQKLPYLAPMLTHPFMEVLRNDWSSVIIPGNDPQRDIDIFDWLFSRGKMNTDWVRLYRYAQTGSFDGSEYFFRDKATAMLFKLTWSGL